MPYIIYADIESLIRKINGCANNRENSSMGCTKPCFHLHSPTPIHSHLLPSTLTQSHPLPPTPIHSHPLPPTPNYARSLYLTIQWLITFFHACFFSMCFLKMCFLKVIETYGFNE